MDETKIWDYEKLYDNKEPPKDVRESFKKNWTSPEIPIEKETKFGWKVLGYDESNPKKLQIGYGCDIGSNVIIFCHEGVRIEPFVQIGPFCAIMSSSTIDNKKGQIIIKRNARIGTHTTIMPGITIGENSIIGAHSFVNRDIPDNVIAWGIPAKIIKKIEGKNGDKNTFVQDIFR